MKDFVNFDLNLLDYNKPIRTGIKGEFLTSPRLDNQVTCFGIMKTICEIPNEDSDSIIASFLFDNEEIGSETTQGANSLIQKSTIDRILYCTKIQTPELFPQVARRSIVINSDCGHAVHPN